jgi:hypothetical protein
MGLRLLAVAAQRDLPVLDEKLSMDVFAQPQPTQRRNAPTEQDESQTGQSKQSNGAGLRDIHRRRVFQQEAPPLYAAPILFAVPSTSRLVGAVTGTPNRLKLAPSTSKMSAKVKEMLHPISDKCNFGEIEVARTGKFNFENSAECCALKIRGKVEGILKSTSCGCPKAVDSFLDVSMVSR